MDRQQKKEALKAFKERKEVGGLYRIINTQTGWRSPLCATVNLAGMQSRFDFAQKTNTCFDNMLQKEWKAHGPEGFVFQVVEALEKKPEHTTADFRDELATLMKLYEDT